MNATDMSMYHKYTYTYSISIHNIIYIIIYTNLVDETADGAGRSVGWVGWAYKAGRMIILISVDSFASVLSCISTKSCIIIDSSGETNDKILR